VNEDVAVLDAVAIDGEINAVATVSRTVRLSDRVKVGVTVRGSVGDVVVSLDADTLCDTVESLDGVFVRGEPDPLRLTVSTSLGESDLDAEDDGDTVLVGVGGAVRVAVTSPDSDIVLDPERLRLIDEVRTSLTVMLSLHITLEVAVRDRVVVFVEVRDLDPILAVGAEDKEDVQEMDLERGELIEWVLAPVSVTTESVTVRDSVRVTDVVTDWENSGDALLADSVSEGLAEWVSVTLAVTETDPVRVSVSECVVVGDGVRDDTNVSVSVLSTVTVSDDPSEKLPDNVIVPLERLVLLLLRRGVGVNVSVRDFSGDSVWVPVVDSEAVSFAEVTVAVLVWDSLFVVVTDGVLD
jgi:hypothetical protein